MFAILTHLDDCLDLLIAAGVNLEQEDAVSECNYKKFICE